MRIAVLDDYQGVAFQFADWSGIRARAEVVVFRENLGGIDEAAEALADFDVICLMRERMPVPAALLERLPNLRLIVVTGAHNRALDLEVALARGIVVSHTRNPATQHPTSELTWALILAAARNLTFENRNLREGGWQRTIGLTLNGRTLGVIGFGRIGSVVGAVGRAFGMEVVAWSPNLTEERAVAGGARLVTKEELLSRSDVVTLHMVLSPRSRGILRADDLALMKPGAILVNTSRGPLVDEAALIAAVRARKIVAALDCYDQEPLPPDHPLRTLDNVVGAPHLGYVTRETFEVFFQDTVEAVEAFLAGAPIRLLEPGPRP